MRKPITFTRAPRVAGVLLGAVLLAGGCAKARPSTVPNGPPLAMPLPPPRIFAPLDEPIAAQPPAPEVANAEPPKPAQRPPARRPAPAPAAERPEPEAPVVAAPAPSPPSPDPARELRAAPSAADAAAERQVREMLQRAVRDLNRVDYRRLSNEGRAQYEQAKRFLDQTEQALKERNLVFAATLADKAATLASQLGG